jgi:hypothetical protein
MVTKESLTLQKAGAVLPGVIWARPGDLGVCESGDVGCVQLLEFDRSAPVQGTLASLPVVVIRTPWSIAAADQHVHRSSSLAGPFT